MYYQKQYNRNNHKDKWNLLQKLTMQLAIVLVILLVLILIKYAKNSLTTKADEGIRNVFYQDYTEQAVEVFNNNLPGAKNILGDMFSNNKEMKLAFLPVQGKIINAFGNVEDITSKKNIMHNGIDIEAKEGIEIKAVFDGEVEEIKLNDESLGQCIIINHKNGFKTLYGHLLEINVEEGQKIKTSDIIGKSGKTGNAKTPQLHFEVWKNYEPVNPMDLLKASSN